MGRATDTFNFVFDIRFAHRLEEDARGAVPVDHVKLTLFGSVLSVTPEAGALVDGQSRRLTNFDHGQGDSLVIIITTVGRNLAFCERAPAADQLRESCFLEDHECGHFHRLGLPGRIAGGGPFLSLDGVDVSRDGAIKGRDAEQVVWREAASWVGFRITASREVEAGGDVGGVGVVERGIIGERRRNSPERGEKGHQTRDEKVRTRHQEHWKKERKNQGTRV